MTCTFRPATSASGRAPSESRAIRTTRAFVEAITAPQPFTVELLYGDYEGGQRAISRFTLVPRQDDNNDTVWLCTVSLHWNLDRPDPR